MTGNLSMRMLPVAAMLAVSGCASIEHRIEAKGEAPVIMGPAARDNTTPLKDTYACMEERLRGARTVGIGVGDIKDYTGKYSDLEGSAVTQGGALMVISALGKLGDTVRIHERFDTSVAELELVYTEKRQLGDGRKHDVDGKTVPWAPYYGGTIRESDYYIVGGITELNYNIQSGGGEFAVSMIGPRAPHLHNERRRRPSHRRQPVAGRQGHGEPAEADHGIRGQRRCL